MEYGRDFANHQPHAIKYCRLYRYRNEYAGLYRCCYTKHCAELAWQAIHLTGAQDESATRAAYAHGGVPAFVAAFHHRMEEAYSASDFAIARSGAASLAELSHFGLPAILIPYPFAADDHQTANAEIFAKAGAGTLLKESDATADTIARDIESFIANPARLAEMSKRSRDIAPARAAECVAETVLKFCPSKP